MRHIYVRLTCLDFEGAGLLRPEEHCSECHELEQLCTYIEEPPKGRWQDSKPMVVEVDACCTFPKTLVTREHIAKVLWFRRAEDRFLLKTLFRRY